MALKEKQAMKKKVKMMKLAWKITLNMQNYSYDSLFQKSTVSRTVRVAVIMGLNRNGQFQSTEMK